MGFLNNKVQMATFASLPRRDRPTTCVSEFTLDGQRYFVLPAHPGGVEMETLPFLYDHFEIVGEMRVEDRIYVLSRLTSPTDHKQDSAKANAIANGLTKREVQIVTLVAEGRGNKQIAAHLRISPWTVSTHLRRIYAKLGVDCRAAMTYRCSKLVERGLLRPL
jgi:DNA-binding CsgD family transcriptional regulator